jgi:hypothetical protein
MRIFLKTGNKSKLDPAARRAEKKRKWKVRKIRMVVFLGLFLVAEIVLRIVGFKPGVIVNAYYQPGDVVYDSVLVADEMGITHHLPNGSFYPGQVLNDQGFFGEINYTPEVMDSIRATGKKIILLVGDSYTAGCCPGSYNLSFAKLLNESDEYVVLNFGVGGTDPLHYELVVKKYLPLLKPDLVSVVVYLGNDEMVYDRTPKPYVPVCYPVKDGFWFSSEYRIDFGDPDTYFKNFNEAKKFYYSYFSLRSDESNWFEKSIRSSVILSRLYLFAKIKHRRWQIGEDLYDPPENPPYTYNHLKEIQQFCDVNETDLLYTAIPSPVDIIDQVDVRKQYHYFFEDLPWSSPSTIKIEDYDGKETGNHYNEEGHRKFTNFIRPLIEEKLK